MSSKEIAIELGLSPKTVDTYLKQACDKFGVINRRDAARLFEAPDVSEKFLSEPQELAEAPIVAKGTAHTGWSGTFETLRIPPVGASANDLPWRGKVVSAFIVSAIGVAFILSILLIFFGLLKTFK